MMCSSSILEGFLSFRVQVVGLDADPSGPSHDLLGTYLISHVQVASQRQRGTGVTPSTRRGLHAERHSARLAFPDGRDFELLRAGRCEGLAGNENRHDRGGQQHFTGRFHSTTAAQT
jgi:hypothetical protein